MFLRSVFILTSVFAAEGAWGETFRFPATYIQVESRLITHIDTLQKKINEKRAFVNEKESELYTLSEAITGNTLTLSNRARAQVKDIMSTGTRLLFNDLRFNQEFMDVNYDFNDAVEKFEKGGEFPSASTIYKYLLSRTYFYSRLPVAVSEVLESTRREKRRNIDSSQSSKADFSAGTDLVNKSGPFYVYVEKSLEVDNLTQLKADLEQILSFTMSRPSLIKRTQAFCLRTLASLNK